MECNKVSEKQSNNSQKTENYDKEAYLHFICEGLNGKGCGTETKNIARWRKEKTWAQKCADFERRYGD